MLCSAGRFFWSWRAHSTARQPSSSASAGWLLAGMMGASGPCVSHHLAGQLGFVHRVVPELQERVETRSWHELSPTGLLPPSLLSIQQITRPAHVWGMGKETSPLFKTYFFILILKFFIFYTVCKGYFLFTVITIYGSTPRVVHTSLSLSYTQ